MKIRLLALLLLSISYIGFSQNTNYGVIAGMNYYMISIEGPLYANSGYGPSLGVFVDHKINSSFGAKANLMYNKTIEEDYYFSDQYSNATPLFNKVELNTIQLDALLKFDVNREYNKGFYVLGGIKLTTILNAKSDTNQYLVNDFYKKVNFGGLFGFGFTFLNNFSIEIMGNTNFTNTLKSDFNKAKNTGGQINLNFNID
ncbi:outer membrane beta-barrel protein [Flavobacterium cellulosilyticum]|uniref:Outer membrane protein beta-barrel domain-containing protein n=1 Tax=Flavobacterium cellulosilyticum TaxID=2541731 RepID=A0A4R5C7V7_9FLAO|nr:outer membrane beta-barrel protein [Flavobacterium cellulosilyticum]TDD94213.1 hypothetical protein E0F76_17370 [Flavobacterium cellulosilyticum]